VRHSKSDLSYGSKKDNTEIEKACVPAKLKEGNVFEEEPGLKRGSEVFFLGERYSHQSLTHYS
jgi:hypothetical protein